MFRNPLTHRPVTLASRTGFQFFVELATLGSILLALIAFAIDFEDRKQARAVNAATLKEIEESQATRREEAIARAWNTLTTPATGNSGKREALEYLAAQGVSLRGIDLSCKKMGGGWDEEKKTCEKPVYLDGLVLKAPEGERVDLMEVHLEGALLRESHLEGAIIIAAHLDGAKFDGAHLETALLDSSSLEMAHLGDANLKWASLTEANLAGAFLNDADLEKATLLATRLNGAYLWGANMEEADLRDAYLRGADLEGVNLSGAQISSADFTDAMRLNTANFTDAWAWSNEPAKGLPEIISVDLCKYREEPWPGGSSPIVAVSVDAPKRPDPCLPPD